MTGRSGIKVPDDVEFVEDSPIRCRYRMIQHVSKVFWDKWSKMVTPGLVHRQKWHKKNRNLQIKDVVLICEPTKIKAKYRLGIVEAVKESHDGCVRSATIRYTSVPTRDTEVARTIRVQRSVQRLCLILPVEEQSAGVGVEVNEHEYHVKCVPSDMN